MEKGINLDRLQQYDKLLKDIVLLRKEYDLTQENISNSLSIENSVFAANKTKVKGDIKIITPRRSDWNVKIYSPEHPYASYYTTTYGSYQVSNINILTFKDTQEILINVDELISVTKIILTEIGDSKNIVNVSELVNDKGYVSIYHSQDKEQIIFNN